MIILYVHFYLFFSDDNIHVIVLETTNSLGYGFPAGEKKPSNIKN